MPILTTSVIAFACVAFPLATSDFFTKGFHLGKFSVYGGHDISAININCAIGAIAQGNVKHGTIFREVNFLTAEHFFQSTF
jgi:hypothetical protein